MIVNLILLCVVLYLEFMRVYERRRFDQEKGELVTMLVRKEIPRSLPPSVSSEHRSLVANQQKRR